MIDWDRSYSQIGGVPPVTYAQNGVAYNARGERLGMIEGAIFVPDEADDVRPQLEDEARRLGVQFRSTLSTPKLRERIDAAKGGWQSVPGYVAAEDLTNDAA